MHFSACPLLAGRSFGRELAIQMRGTRTEVHVPALSYSAPSRFSFRRAMSLSNSPQTPVSPCH